MGLQASSLTDESNVDAVAHIRTIGDWARIVSRAAIWLHNGGFVAKVFCIGFHKTGTSSIGRALAHLGFRVTGPNFVQDPRIHSQLWSLARPLIDRYDAFQDNPWPILFREIDNHVPEAKFVLTWRDPLDWIESVEVFFGNRSTEMRKLIYGRGSPDGQLERYLARYRRHQAEVEAHFAENPSRLLRMNVLEGDAWPELCRFVGRPVPDVPFPHVRPRSMATESD